MADNRPPVYWEDDELIIRASAIGGSCLFELVASGQGYELLPVPPKLQRAFDEGNTLEPVINHKLTNEYGVRFISNQDEGNWHVAPGITIRYHPDGIADWETQNWVVEDKALSDVLWQIFYSRGMQYVIDEYQWQLSVMMHHQQLPGLWAGLNKGGPVDEFGVHETCPDMGRLHLQPVMTPLISAEEIRAKAMTIRELVTGDDILDTQRPCDDYNHWPCRYLYLRPEGGRNMGASDEDVLVIGTEDQDEVNQLLREYYSFKGSAYEAGKQADERKERILALAGKNTRIITDKWNVPIVSSSSSKIAWDDMSVEEKELMEKFKRQNPYRYVGKGKRVDE